MSRQVFRGNVADAALAVSQLSNMGLDVHTPTVPHVVAEVGISFYAQVAEDGAKLPRRARLNNATACLEATLASVDNWLDGLSEEEEGRHEVVGFREELQDILETHLC